jgi:hypothetical protein
MNQTEYVKGPNPWTIVIFIIVAVGLVAVVFMLFFLCNVIITIYAVLTVVQGAVSAIGLVAVDSAHE